MELKIPPAQGRPPKTSISRLEQQSYDKEHEYEKEEQDGGAY